MRIAIVSTFYSEGMGYTENCLPKALAQLGHEVHVLTSPWNVYGTSGEYATTYHDFLGPADQGTGSFQSEGFQVHRLPADRVGGYIRIRGLARQVARLEAEIVHVTEIASLQTFRLAAAAPYGSFRLFTETHQHLSVIKPYLNNPRAAPLRTLWYRATRTLPTFLASLAVRRCYAIAPDCIEVARRFYGVPSRKLALQSLGTDTERFHPAETPQEIERRTAMRRSRGWGPDDVVCIYTGRLSADKNPLALGQAVDALATRSKGVHAIFVGAGAQREAIAACRNTSIVPFMRHVDLADYYRMADIAVWPRQESLSMLDAAASGLPVIAADSMGQPERVDGNGRTYRENDSADLAEQIATLGDATERARLGAAGRRKMVSQFSWRGVAEALESDFRASLAT